MNLRRTLPTSQIARTLPAALLAAVLWVLRPGLPDLPGSLNGPVMIEQLEDVLAFLAWLALIVLVIATASRTARTTKTAPDERSHADPHHRVVDTATRPMRARAPIDPPPALTVASPHREPAPVATGDPPDASPPVPLLLPRLRISLLGSFAIERADGAVRSVRSSTEQLIAYLALRPRGATRDELVEAIWPGEDPRRTRQRLWQSTSEARKLIADALISQRGHYSLDRTKVTVDADDLEALRADAKETTTAAVERRVLERGLHLLRGEPLAGWDHVWADTDTGRLRATQAELLERLGRARFATGDAHGALEAAEEGLDRDTLNEALWRLAMQAETELGLREAVGRRYERLRDLLNEQLGLQPETQTRTLVHDLLGQR